MERLTYYNEEVGCWSYHGTSGNAALRLKAYEDTGLEPEEIKRAFCAAQFTGVQVDMERGHKIIDAEKEGRLVVLPFVAMVEQSLQDGKMKPQRDQRFNGRYAVVYSDPDKWGCPLIDICGDPYDRTQAEERMAALAERKGRE